LAKVTDFVTEYIQSFNFKGDTARETTFNINIQCQSALIRPALIFDSNIDTKKSTILENSSSTEYAKNNGVQLLKDGKIIIPKDLISLSIVTITPSDHVFSSRLVKTGSK
jgi:hypothetical protein